MLLNCTLNSRVLGCGVNVIIHRECEQLFKYLQGVAKVIESPQWGESDEVDQNEDSNSNNHYHQPIKNPCCREINHNHLQYGDRKWSTKQASGFIHMLYSIHFHNISFISDTMNNVPSQVATLHAHV